MGIHLCLLEIFPGLGVIPGGSTGFYAIFIKCRWNKAQGQDSL